MVQTDVNEMIKVETPVCHQCGERGSVMMTPEQVVILVEDRGQGLIQNLFPELSAEDREMLINGTHPACWDKAMGPEPED